MKKKAYTVKINETNEKMVVSNKGSVLESRCVRQRLELIEGSDTPKMIGDKYITDKDKNEYAYVDDLVFETTSQYEEWKDNI